MLYLQNHEERQVPWEYFAALYKFAGMSGKARLEPMAELVQWLGNILNPFSNLPHIWWCRDGDKP